MSPRSAVRRGGAVARSRPLERSFTPHVDEAEREHEDEDRHLDEPEEPERTECDRPRVEEDDFHVEDDEEDGGEIEFDGEAAPRRPARRVPALEVLELLGR